MIDARDLVTGLSLLAGSACLILYFAEAWLAVRAGKAAASDVTSSAAGISRADAVSPSDFAGLLEAIAKLTDSLGKAGPSLTSLIGAVLFYAIAAIGSGALQKPAPVTTTASSHAPTDSNQTGSGAVSHSQEGKGTDQAGKK